MGILKRIIDSFIYRIRKRKTIDRIINGGGKLGRKVSLVVLKDGNFICGKNVVILSSGIEYAEGCRIAVLPGATLRIGDNTGMSQVSITCKDSITIGSHCTIGAGVMMFDTNFHNTDWRVRRTPEDLKTAKTAPITIGDDCFIGTRSIICKGVCIGNRTIIAAGSVVVSDIPSDCIAGGNPCKVIKQMNNNEDNRSNRNI